MVLEDLGLLCVVQVIRRRGVERLFSDLILVKRVRLASGIETVVSTAGFKVPVLAFADILVKSSTHFPAICKEFVGLCSAVNQVRLLCAAAAVGQCNNDILLLNSENIRDGSGLYISYLRVAPGEDPRSGRWAGLTKTECGLHV